MKHDGNARSRKSDSSIVPKKPSNKDPGVPWSAERVEGRESGRREYGFVKQVLNTASEKDTVWPSLNGHNTGNRRHSQGKTPVAVPKACQAHKNVYGRKPLRIKGYDSQRSGTTSTTPTISGNPTTT
jgi:hypothetical protein